jgi:hypothetical protein
MNSNLNRHHRRRAAALGMTVDEYSEALDEQDAEPREPQDPEYITLKETCEVVGGTKPISLPTLYRDPELRALIEHPTSRLSRIRLPKLLGLLNARAARSSNGGAS